MCGALPDGPLWGHGLGAVPVRRVAPAGRNPTHGFTTVSPSAGGWRKLSGLEIYRFRIRCFITKSGQDARAPRKGPTRNEGFQP